jgi:L-lactate dehydrogenase (cytochrome)
MTDSSADLKSDVPANFQYEIYGRGLIEETPKLPVAVAELQERARGVLSAEAFGYVSGGAGAERTIQANLDAFERWKILPRMLRDVSVRDLGTSVLGTAMSAPVMLAPIGVQSIIHPEAELAAARAAASQEVPFILSTAASRSIEEVAEAMGEASRWYQLRRDRCHARYLAPRLATARPSAWLSAVSQRRGGRQLLQRSRLPVRTGEDPRARPRAGARSLGLPVRQSQRHLG